MNRLARRFLGFWWWLWMAIWAPLFAILLTLVIWFGNRKFKRRFARLCYYWVPRWLCWPCGIRFKSIGLKNLKKGEQYIIVSNHNSTLDIFANPGTSPVFYKFLAKAEIQRIPLLGKIASPFCIFVDRKNKSSRTESFERLVEVVEQDTASVFIYPEGTRNRTSEPLKEFYNGAFKLAIRTQKPIVVQTLLNTRKLGPPDDLFNLAPGLIQSIWHEPISTEGMTLEDVPKLKERVRSIMTLNLNQYASQSKGHA
jgi:1-acyl-sn-glycerol-3-phosphate acyltransferase